MSSSLRIEKVVGVAIRNGMGAVFLALGYAVVQTYSKTSTGRAIKMALDSPDLHMFLILAFGLGAVYGVTRYYLDKCRAIKAIRERRLEKIDKQCKAAVLRIKEHERARIHEEEEQKIDRFVWDKMDGRLLYRGVWFSIGANEFNFKRRDAAAAFAFCGGSEAKCKVQVLSPTTTGGYRCEACGKSYSPEPSTKMDQVATYRIKQRITEIEVEYHQQLKEEKNHA